MSEFHNFIKFSDSIDQIENETIENGKSLLTFGIPFLDHSLRGISKTDVVLLGAGSGGGKTEAGVSIGFHNALNGKKVLYFALEAEKYEIEIRQLYKLLTKKYYEDKNRIYCDINYADFYYGRCWFALKKYLDEAKYELKQSENFLIRYSSEDYTLEKFAIDIESFSDADLIIMDHLHYLELGDDNENKLYKKAMKMMRDSVLKYKIPIILIAQLRKETIGPRLTSVIPEISDFHGSSDIYKIATKAIMFADGTNVCDYSAEHEYQRHTLIKTQKNRIDGSVKPFVGLLTYDFRTNSYLKGYKTGRLSFEKDETTGRLAEKFKEDLERPKWAKMI